MCRLLDYLLLCVMVGWVATPMQGAAMGMDSLVINEFNVQGASQYVELYDGGVGGTSLDGLVLVLFSGASETINSRPLVLDGYRTDEEGYFLVSFGPALPNTDLTSSTILITSGLNAIAVYDMSSGNLQVGSMVTDAGLVDAVVYGRSASPQDSRLVSILSAGQDPLQTDGSSLGDQETSLSRCRGWKQIMHSSFRTARQTPGTDNACTLPSFVLNEINTRPEDATEQFIEIFDGGVGFQSMDGVMLAAYSGGRHGDNAMLSVDLTDYSTDANGFFIVAGNWTDLGDVGAPRVWANWDLMMNSRSPTGVALHLGSPRKFALGAALSNYNLIDAVVYGSRPDPQLIYMLSPGEDTHVDVSSTDSWDYSISRCYCCSPRNSSAFGKAPISPRAINRNCSIANRTVLETPVVTPLRINEVHIGTSESSDGDFIEIYDGGYGPTIADGKVLVVYKASDDGGRSYRIVDLSNYDPNDEGYILISPESSVSGQTTLTDDWLRAGMEVDQVAGAVALYEGNAASFRVGDQPTAVGLIDAVLFGNQSAMTSSLPSALMPGQNLIYDFLPDSDSSALRCYSHKVLDQASFTPGSPSPAAANKCPKPPFVVNEVNILLTSASGVWVEVSSMGIPNLPLDNIIPVLWVSNPFHGRSRSYAGRRTNEDGYYSQSVYFIDRMGFNAPFAVALYYAPDATDIFDERHNIQLTNTGLIDAVVIGWENSPSNQTLLDILTPGMPQFQEREAFSHRDESLSRCMINGNWTFVPAHVSRDAPNHCPTRLSPDVVINEINLATDHQFIELFDLGVGYTLLDDVAVVLYDGDGTVLEIMSLSGYATDASGYFVLGVQSFENVGRVTYPFAKGLMNPRYGAVGLYRVTNGATLNLTVGDGPTSQGLIDLVDYEPSSNSLSISDRLLKLMSDDSHGEVLQSDQERFSRCFSGDLRSSRAFGSRPTTIAAMNDCPLFPDRDVVINELNFDTSYWTPTGCLELYDGGRGNTSLEYLSLVMFSAPDDTVYRTVDLSGHSTNKDGYFVVGTLESADLVVSKHQGRSWRFLPRVAGAAALYRSHPGAFHFGTPATTRSLLDAVVYTMDVETETTLVDDLLPRGNFLIYKEESENDDSSPKDISRCFDNSRLTQSALKWAERTPGERNACGSKGSVVVGTDIFINEVNVEAASGQDFVELYDGGVGDTLLDGYVLVFFAGSNRDRSFYEVDLTGKRTGSSGYLVIGGTGVTPTPDVIANGLSIPPGSGAVVLYQDSLEFLQRGMEATQDYLVDVVVFGDPRDRAVGLIGELVPGQIYAYENSDLVPGADVSLSRCISQSRLTVAAFVSSLSTPGSPNNCILYPVSINEISPGGTPTDAFVELYDGGRGYTSLDAIVLLVFEEGKNVPFGKVILTGQRTDRDGYFVFQGVPGVGNEFQSSGTVALYRGDHAKFSTTEAPDDSALVDKQTYSSRDLDVSLFMGSSSVPGKGFSRCESCRSPGSSYLALAPASPGAANQCPSPDYGNQISVKLTDASYDAWKSDNSLVTELEGIIADGVNSRCQCGFSLDYLCDKKLLQGSVVYQAKMYSTDADQSEMLSDSFQEFLMGVDKVSVGKRDYVVDKPKDMKPDKGLAVPEIVIIAVVCALVVAAAGVVVAYIVLKRRSTKTSGDNLTLEENGASSLVEARYSANLDN